MRRLLAFALSAFVIQSIRGNERIIGGNETEIENVPYIAALQQIVLLWVYHVCGAAIISTKFLLTTAHCIPDNKSPLYARVGSSKYDSGGQVLKIHEIFQHPYYNDLIEDFDFAILNFEPGVEINLGPKVAVISLPSEEDPADDSFITVAGWGYVTSLANNYSVYLKEVDIPVVNQEYCKIYYSSLTPRKMCAAGVPEGNINFCAGDDGGPATQDGVLYGLMIDVSWMGCEAKGRPSVLARVSSVNDWILNNTRII